jgi:hypothetical protein
MPKVLCVDGITVSWPYGDRDIVASIDSSHLMRLNSRHTVTRAIAASELNGPQKRKLFPGPKIHIVRALASSGNRIRSLNLEDYAMRVSRITYRDLACICGKAGKNRRKLIEYLLPFVTTEDCNE